MICGLGVDLVKVQRLAEALERYGDAFARKVLSAPEMHDYETSAIPERLIAKRFAAKEAFVKALGTGIGASAAWHDIRIIHDGQGRPGFEISGKAAQTMERLGATTHHLSLSDEQEYVVAVAVLENPG
ncbi:MAG: holo-ACP synthase [Pseudomonadota bacterium]|nr:holo-ACP synthase [Pseudomonadota bacterium]